MAQRLRADANRARLSLLTMKEQKKRPIAVQLTRQTIEGLDRLAAKSGITRHRYMIRILERAVKADVVVREEVAFSNELP
jgi:predicted DNA binding CopG/RHH family protein